MSRIPSAPWAANHGVPAHHRSDWLEPLPPPQRMSYYPTIPVPLGLTTTATPPHRCPYLTSHTSVSRGFRCEQLPGWAYQSLLDAGFRRSGDVLYQMVCAECRACRPLRVPVDPFRPSRSQRRAWRRNQDLRVDYAPPRPTEEKHSLYSRYLQVRHDGSMSGSWEEMVEFLYRSPTESVELCYRAPGGALVGVGICDLTPAALSTVYFFFEPTLARRSLGVFSSLVEIEVAREAGLRHYYLGYWVPGCPRMEYKAAFRPAEVLCGDAVWRPLPRDTGADNQPSGATGAST